MSMSYDFDVKFGCCQSGAQVEMASATHAGAVGRCNLRSVRLEDGGSGIPCEFPMKTIGKP